MSRPVAVLLSGGLDSSVLLYYVARRARPNVPIVAINLAYGARHNAVERFAAHNVVKALSAVAQVRLIERDLMGLVDVEQASFPSAPLKVGETNPVIFPGRNLLLIAAANSIMMGYNCKELYIGTAGHDAQGDLFPDCTMEFTEAVHRAMKVGYQTHVWQPFITMYRSEIVQLGSELGVPFERTYSCYRGGERHCGECATCLGRKEGFDAASISDPTSYDH